MHYLLFSPGVLEAEDLDRAVPQQVDVASLPVQSWVQAGHHLEQHAFYQDDSS